VTHLVPTPSQTAGPFVEIGMRWNATGRLVPAGTPGEICLSGLVRDGAGAPVSDAALEFWQADPAGRYDGYPGGGDWTGFARAFTGKDGRYVLFTVKPGAFRGAGDSAREAPHVNISIFARGLLHRLVTRCYFDDEKEANAADPVLSSVADPPTRSRLLASLLETGNPLATPGETAYRFDICLQGDAETPFFLP
jgi:protocatechuate 3,4-dioxygenase alpha subunit